MKWRSSTLWPGLSVFCCFPECDKVILSHHHQTMCFRHQTLWNTTVIRSGTAYGKRHTIWVLGHPVKTKRGEKTCSTHVWRQMVGGEVVNSTHENRCHGCTHDFEFLLWVQLFSCFFFVKENVFTVRHLCDLEGILKGFFFIMKGTALDVFIFWVSEFVCSRRNSRKLLPSFFPPKSREPSGNSFPRSWLRPSFFPLTVIESKGKPEGSNWDRDGVKRREVWECEGWARAVLCCLLWIDKARSKDKTYICVSVWWRTKT